MRWMPINTSNSQNEKQIIGLIERYLYAWGYLSFLFKLTAMKKNPTLNIGNWPMEKLIQFYYPRIKEVVILKSLKMRIDSDELLGNVNYCLSNATAKKQFTGSKESEFIAWVNTLIFNAGINMIRQNKKDSLYLVNVDPEEHDIDQLSKAQSFQPCNSHKIFLKSISEHINNKYQTKSRFYLDVFNHVLIDGEQYHEAADALQININSIKTAVFQIRKTVIEKFGQEYTELINN